MLVRGHDVCHMVDHKGAHVTGDNFLCHELLGVKTVQAGAQGPSEYDDNGH